MIAPAVVEPAIAEAWLYQVLSGDATLQGLNSNVAARVYPWVAPEDADEPYIVYQGQASRDLTALGGIRIWNTLPYLVVAVMETAKWEDLAPIADRIDALLHGKSGTVSAAGGIAAGVIHESIREQSFALPEVVAGKQKRRLGGIYRLRVSGS